MSQPYDRIRNFATQIGYEWLKATPAERIAAIVAVSLPLERVPSLELFGFTIRVSTVAGSILIALWLLTIAKSRSLSWRLPQWLLLGYLAWIVAGLATVKDVRAGLGVVLPTAFVVLLAFAVGGMVRKTQVLFLFRWLVLGAVLAALYGLFQFVGDVAGLPSWLTSMRPEYSWDKFGFPRVASTALEPLFFSAYLLLPMSVLLQQVAVSKTIKNLVTVTLILLIAVDVLTLSRGGLVALVAVSIVSGLLLLVSAKAKLAVRLWAVLSGLLVVGAACGLLAVSVLDRPGTDSDLTYQKQGVATFVEHLKNTRLTPSASNVANDDSVYNRASTRQRAVEDATDSPKVFLLGMGSGQYGAYNLERHNDTNTAVANVLVLDIVLQQGLIGLLLVASAVGMLVVWLFKAQKLDGGYWSVVERALVAYFLALGLQSLTFSTLYLTHLWFAVGVALVLVGRRRASA